VIPPPAAPVAVAPPPLNFHDLVAIKIAFMMAVLATLMSFLPYVNWLAAGFFAALMYRRRTGYLLNLESGLRREHGLPADQSLSPRPRPLHGPLGHQSKR
jgi:hypothetical protein